MPPGTPVLDFVRYHQYLTGTKIGCREGDCGACTVLVGDLTTGVLRYRTMTSCLMPLGNAQGKHIVTIEGVNLPELTPIQQAMSDESATQCGFCTPGFVMSLTGFCLSGKESTQAIAAIDGNICRCTGYKSIERAANRVAKLVEGRGQQEPAAFAAQAGMVPAYFTTIANRLRKLQTSPENTNAPSPDAAQWVAGGTDVYVQKHDDIKTAPIRFLLDNPTLKGIRQEGDQCVIGASTTVADLLESLELRQWLPGLPAYAKLVSSTPIRNMATLGGNLVNASPIGDFTILLLALGAELTVRNENQSRSIPLNDFYLGYKRLAKHPDEYLETIRFAIPGLTTGFNFEKVSKRTHLDIASVNSAIQLTVQDAKISSVKLSAGGVGPTPMRLPKTEAFLIGQVPTEVVVLQATEMVQSEIAPISDARGSEAYKRLLLKQLLKAHFIKLFPTLNTAKLLAG